MNTIGLIAFGILVVGAVLSYWIGAYDMSGMFAAAAVASGAIPRIAEKSGK